jgi:hypothetical protein
MKKSVKLSFTLFLRLEIQARILDAQFYSFILNNSAIVSELPGVNKYNDNPINKMPIRPGTITLLLNKELFLNAYKPALKTRKIPVKRMIK